MRENGFRAIGGLAQRLTSAIVEHRAKSGRMASIARLRAQWIAIAGSELARVTRPEALLAARGRSGKALRLRVQSAAALEIQHQIPQIVERVNAYFGHRMIDDIRLVQGVIDASPAPPAVATPAPDIVRQAAERTASVDDPALRAALARLGARLASRRRVLLGALGAAVVIRDPHALHAQDLRQDLAQDLPREKLLDPLPGDHILGNPEAPNTLIDYASFTCPHCANFYIAVMPTLRQEWIDSGRLRLIHRHFPLDVVATRASQLAECAGSDPKKFFARVDLLFHKQVDWLSMGDPLVEMVKVLASQGVTAKDAELCFANDRVLDKVIADVQGGQTLGVTFTPTLFINEESYGNPGNANAISAILRQVGR
jgi:hypothetical protein